MSRTESPEEARERMRREVLQEAGQACLDWADDTGDCHLCGYDKGAGKPHEEHCPLRKLTTTAELVALQDRAARSRPEPTGSKRGVGY
jgi:hypothetical protein